MPLSLAYGGQTAHAEPIDTGTTTCTNTPDGTCGWLCSTNNGQRDCHKNGQTCTQGKISWVCYRGTTGHGMDRPPSAGYRQ